MREVSRAQVIQKIRSTNSWWSPPSQRTAAQSVPFQDLAERPYFDLFKEIALRWDPVRAVVLMGPRRVGKTVLLFHFIRLLIGQGFDAKKIYYLDLQQPLFSGLGLEQLLQTAIEAAGTNELARSYFIFDEIQYFRDWELHLKALVDSYTDVKFIATGSAAAALRLKSTESGAGRFTDFLLPPLTFFEYLELVEQSNLVRCWRQENKLFASTADMALLNRHFIDYLNCGGYPEAVFSTAVRGDLQRYIRSDIIDKVLLKDLPSLYGIQDIRELNSLFTSLAYNSANEVSLGELSQNSGVAKNTIKRYIEYLESAFLIRVVHRLDNNAKKFQRANFFKVYLTNPSIRSALFSPVADDDEDIGSVVETAVFAQWFHSMSAELHYARWKGGEVDIILLDGRQQPLSAIEVKWSDRFERRPHELRGFLEFLSLHPQCVAHVTTKATSSTKHVDGHEVGFIPAALYCYALGCNIIKHRSTGFDVIIRAASQEAIADDAPGSAEVL
jgi:predicted AAA+ superfamily ATPase